MLDVTVINPFTTVSVYRSGLRGGYAIEKAAKGKHDKYRSTHHATYTLLPLALSTGGDCSTAVHDLVKDLGRLKAEQSDDYLLAGESGKIAIRGRETGRLRRQLSMTLQRALAYRALRYCNKQRTPGTGNRQAPQQPLPALTPRCPQQRTPPGAPPLTSG